MHVDRRPTLFELTLGCESELSSTEAVQSSSSRLFTAIALHGPIPVFWNQVTVTGMVNPSVGIDGWVSTKGLVTQTVQ